MVSTKTTAIIDKPKKDKVKHGIPCSEKGLKEYEKAWKDMEDCFKRLK